jgi:hypothetical protein
VTGGVLNAPIKETRHQAKVSCEVHHAEKVTFEVELLEEGRASGEVKMQKQKK